MSRSGSRTRDQGWITRLHAGDTSHLARELGTLILQHRQWSHQSEDSLYAYMLGIERERLSFLLYGEKKFPNRDELRRFAALFAPNDPTYLAILYDLAGYWTDQQIAADLIAAVQGRCAELPLQIQAAHARYHDRANAAIWTAPPRMEYAALRQADAVLPWLLSPGYAALPYFTLPRDLGCLAPTPKNRLARMLDLLYAPDRMNLADPQRPIPQVSVPKRLALALAIAPVVLDYVRDPLRAQPDIIHPTEGLTPDLY